MFGLSALYTKLIGGAIVVLMIIGSYWYVYHLGYSAAQTDTLKASVEAYKKRGGIDEDVKNLGDYQLCLELGGLPSDCEQLRRVVPSTQDK